MLTVMNPRENERREKEDNKSRQLLEGNLLVKGNRTWKDGWSCQD